jgi:putative ABC transport system permease protein
MIIHDLKLSFRQLTKNKVHSFLGIVSFAFGFAVCLIIALLVYHELTIDTCFENHHRIYRLVNAERNSVYMIYQDTDILRENYPEIEKLCPIESHARWARPVYTGEKSVYIHSTITTDNSFFDVFQIPIVKSLSKNPLSQPEYAVLTESGANLLFGNEDPLGKQITLDNDKLLMVSAVIKDFPENASIKADILLSVTNKSIRGSSIRRDNEWYYSVGFYAMLFETASVKELTQKMNDTLEGLGAKIHQVKLQRLDEIYLGKPVNGNDNKAGNSVMLAMFGAIGLLILVLSVINHINFILSFQLKKLKEIGIKKTSGASFKQLMGNYFVEVSLWLIFSFTLALIFVEVALPYVNYLFDASLQITTILTMPFGLYMLLAFIAVLLISCIADIYILSRFDFRSFISGELRGIRKHTAQNVMTIFQFAVSIILLIGVLVIQKQIQYVKHRDLGFNQEQLLMLKFPFRYQHGQALQSQVMQHPSIINSSLSMGNPGNILHTAGAYDINGKEFLINRIDVDYSFLETFEIKLLQGRSFLQGENDKACLINETAFKRYGWESYDGQAFEKYQVVGIVKDFHISSLVRPMEPVTLVLNNYMPTTLNLRISPNHIGETMAFIQKAWNAVSPQTPFDYQFYDDWYDSVYRSEERLASTITLFAFIAFLITSLGLLGQTIHICLNRTKEIGIRKIVGATVSGIILLITKQFVKWVLIANAIAWPVAWFVMKNWLQSFAYRVDLTLWPFLLAALFALVIALLTISWQAVRAATANPVEALRYE